MRKEFFKNIRRVTVKVGTSAFADNAQFKPERVADFARGLIHLKKNSTVRELILVSSGAIACGMKILSLKKRPTALSELQALAALGQGRLVEMYHKVFESSGIPIAQILLTWDDFKSRKRFENVRKTTQALLGWNVLPIVNENDTVSTEEIRFGDNDQLSSMYAIMMNMDLLVLLTDSNGFYADYGAGESSRLGVVEDLPRELFAAVQDRRKEESLGGMAMKLKAVERSLKAGIPCVLANGKDPDVLARLFAGEDVGTLFLPKLRSRQSSKQHWLAYVAKPEGEIHVDTGAADALVKSGRSLLSKGIVRTKGRFDEGASVQVIDASGRTVAKGIVNFSSAEITQIKSLKSTEWSRALGRDCADEVIHRDNLVFL